ncbi:DinB family protein [Pleomorphovibrio marinus]|uniref:DinB family protein n=1 Tax=Pleomorphovibrio marinus TaxID=2164132 RepID=UPI000E0B780B|nr:DinB family protein [Pleomorphovibrio marinus]
MKEKADKWQMEIAELSYSFEKTVKGLPLEKLNHKPSPNRWSVAENLAHLITVNSSYFPTFDQILEGSYRESWLAKLPLIPQKTGELLLKAMKQPRKTKTFGTWKPNKSLYDERILEAFFDQQHELSNYIQQLESKLEKDVIIASPVSNWVVYPLFLAFEIIIAHEERHLKQIEQTLLA